MFVKQTLLSLIKFYQRIPFPHVCRFQPTCSEYLYQAIKHHGIIKGLFLGTKRIFRCHPGNKGGFDPVCHPALDAGSLKIEKIDPETSSG